MLADLWESSESVSTIASSFIANVRGHGSRLDATMPRYLYSTAVLTHAVWILVLLSLSAVLGIIDELRVEIEVGTVFVVNCD